MATEQREDGLLFAVSGTSRWGKSKWVKEQINNAARVMVWDPRGEYGTMPGFVVVKSIPELAELLRENKTSELRVSYWGSLSGFSDFCSLAYSWGHAWPCVIVAEELASVSQVGKAVDAWGDLIRMGLFYGNHIYAIFQRPQEVDRTTKGNVSCYHTHGFVHPDDQEAMAKVIGCHINEIDELKPGQWLERWAGVKEIKRGGTAYGVT